MKIEYRQVNYKQFLFLLNHNEAFTQHITLSDSQYRENMLILKLETMLDKETLDEVKEVFFLKYEEGANDASY